MDINGIVTAKSEVIQLKSGCAFLFALYNKFNDATFYVFVQGPMLSQWKQKIAVNQCYVLSHLRTCFLRTKAIKDIETYKVVSETRLQEVKEKDIHSVKLTSKLELVTFNKNSGLKNNDHKSGPLIISYEGYVTGVKNSSFGIYELDRKILLYTTFLKHSTVTPAFSEGFFLLICNVHLLQDSKGAKNLVCCGLSSVEVVEPHQEQIGSTTERNSCIKLINDFGFNFSDFKWLENCLEALSEKFYPTSILNANHNPFSWDSEIIETVIPNLVRCRNGAAIQSREGLLPRCIIKEFMSDPHSCVITSQSNLGKEYAFQSISEILGGPKEDIFTYHSKSWSCSSVCVPDGVVLAGFLHVSKNGCMYLADSSTEVLLVFYDDTEPFESCSFNCISELLKPSLSNKVLVALKDFHVICEEIADEAKQINFCLYVRISCIFPLCELTDITDIHDSFETLSLACFDNQDADTNVKDLRSFGKVVMQSSHDKCERTGSACAQDETCSLCSLTKGFDSLELEKGSCDHWKYEQQHSWYTKQKILICGKTLPVLKNDMFYQEVPVLLLGVESVIKDHGKSGIKADSFELSSLAESVCVGTDTKVKPAVLSFKGSTIKDGVLLFPHFLYSMLLPISTDKAVFGCHSDTNCHNGASTLDGWTEVAIVKICLGAKFIIEPDLKLELQSFLKKSSALLPKKYSVEEIVQKRSLNKFDFVRGIVMDRWTEAKITDSHFNASKDHKMRMKTLVFDLKDCHTSSSVRVYVSKFILPVPGLIPGATVDIFGLSCHCSKRGNVYLKSDGPFGLYLVNINAKLAKELSQSFYDRGKQLEHQQVPWNFLSRITADKKFKSMCFVLKILKAEIFGVCSSCGENTLKSCVCTSKLFVKSKAFFLVDDGSSQNFVSCAEESVQVLLSLDHSEWNALTLHVQETRKSLTYDHKSQASVPETFSISSLFNLLCSSSLVRRQIVIECRPYLSSDSFLENSNSTVSRRNDKDIRLFAFSLYEPKTRDVALEYLNHLKKRLK